MPYYNSPYQPYNLYSPNMPQAQPQQQTNNGIIWVQGEAGAKSYYVAPNTTVQLWDSETQTIYLKSADASGMPSMKVLRYKIEEPQAAPTEAGGYATRGDIDSLLAQISDLRAEIDGLSIRRPSKKKEVTDDE